MAEKTWGAAARKLLDFLRDNGPRVAFFQAMLALERLFPHEVQLGREGPATEEPIRIRPSISLSSPPADIESITPSDDGDQVTITATFLGLYGIDSPLPTSYVEQISQSQGEPEGERIKALLDIFHQRLYSLLYRAWRKSRPVTSLRGIDPLFDRALALTGYSNRLALGGPTLPRLNEARLRVLPVRSAVSLKAFLQLRLGYKCEIAQLRGRMAEIPLDQRMCLGQANTTLGRGTILGASVHDRNRIRVSVKVDGTDGWKNFAPGAKERVRLERAIDDFLQEPIDREIDVHMPTDAVSPMCLGDGCAALGRDTWLGRPTGEAHWRWHKTG